MGSVAVPAGLFSITLLLAFAAPGFAGPAAFDTPSLEQKVDVPAIDADALPGVPEARLPSNPFPKPLVFDVEVLNIAVEAVHDPGASLLDPQDDGKGHLEVRVDSIRHWSGDESEDGDGSPLDAEARARVDTTPRIVVGHPDDGTTATAPRLATVPASPSPYASRGGEIRSTRDVATQTSDDRALVPAALASAVGGPAGVAAVALGLGVLALGPWLLYHRIRGHSTLENGTRKHIYDAVCATPGAGVQEVADAAKVTYSTASYHLDRLVGAGMLVLSSEGSRLRYYKNGGVFTEDERKLVPVLESEEACRVLDAILDRPWTYRAALAEKLGVSATTVNWHLRRLLELGLVSEVREGRSAHLYADRTKLARALGPVAQKMTAAPEPARRILERLDTPPAIPAVAQAA